MTRIALKIALVVGVCTVLGLLYAVQIQFILERSNRSLTLALLLTGPLTFWYTWGVFLPVITWITRRFPVERGNLAGSIMMHVAASVLLAFAHQFVYFAVRDAAGDPGAAAAPPQFMLG